MTLIKNLILFSLLASTAAQCPNRTGDGLKCLSESTWNYVTCVVNDCPEADELCTGFADDGDDCADVSGICTAITDECCKGNCGCDLEWLINCATGSICEDLTCGADSSARNLLEDLPFVTKEQEEEKQLQRELAGENVACLSEAIGEYTECVIKQCPTADSACQGTASHGDTCDDVEGICTKISTDCCPECANELAFLMNCATGDLCDDFDCGSEQSPQGSGSFEPGFALALVMASLVLAI